jgi:hypothetical protein
MVRGAASGVNGSGSSSGSRSSRASGTSRRSSGTRTRSTASRRSSSGRGSSRSGERRQARREHARGCRPQDRTVPRRRVRAGPGGGRGHLGRGSVDPEGRARRIRLRPVTNLNRPAPDSLNGIRPDRWLIPEAACAGFPRARTGPNGPTDAAAGGPNPQKLR